MISLYYNFHIACMLMQIIYLWSILLELSHPRFKFFLFLNSPHIFAFLCFIHPLRVLVEVFKVLCNDWYGQREDQHPGCRTDSAHQLAKAGGGRNVSVAHGGHGDDAVVDGRGDGGEARLLVQLYVVAETADDETGDAHEEDEQPELLVAVLEGVGDGLETRGVPGQLQHPGQLEDPEDLQDVVDAARRGASAVRSRGRGGGDFALLGREESIAEVTLKEERHEERQDGENIDDVEAIREKLTLGWSSSKSENR